jgi:broad specificity phosphatase PhoE
MNLVKKIYLVRHGTTAANQADILQGRIDNGLNDLGQNEAKALSQRFSGKPLDMIFHSPLSRAKETAEIVNGNHSVEMVEIKGFVEVDLGIWEGRKYTEVIREGADAYREWLASPACKIPGGESFEQVYQRVGAGVADILTSPHRNIMVVGHATVNRAVLGHLLGMNMQAARLFRVKNCSLSAFLVYRYELSRVKDRIILDFWDDTSHLEG